MPLETVVSRHCDETPLLQENDVDVPATYSHNCVDLDVEAEWKIAHMMAVDEPLNHTVSKTKFTDLQERSRWVNATDSPCRRYLSFFYDKRSWFHFARFSAPIAGYIYSNDPLKHHAEMSEVQIKYDHLVAQLRTVTSECDTWRSLARELGDEIINFRAVLGSSRDKLKKSEGEIVFAQKKKDGVLFNRDQCYANLVAFRHWWVAFELRLFTFAKCLNDESLRNKTGRAATVNKAEDVDNHVLSNHMFLMKPNLAEVARSQDFIC